MHRSIDSNVPISLFPLTLPEAVTRSITPDERLLRWL